jgi:hypothetical protein
MERELWPVLYRLVMGAGASFRQKGVVYQPHVLVLVLLWGALHDRPRRWACASANWSTTTLRPAGLPDPATLSRRLRSIAVGMLLRDLLSRLRDLLPAPLLSIVDGMPLAIGGAGHDPDARDGHGAGKFARGYKLHAIGGAARPPRRSPSSR